MQLEIRRRRIRKAPQKAAALGAVRRHHAGAVLAVAEGLLDQVQRTAQRDAEKVQGLGPVVENIVGMVLEIFAHARQIVDHRDAEFLQFGAGANS